MNYYWYEPSGRIVMSASGITPEQVSEHPESGQYAVLASAKTIPNTKAAYVQNGQLCMCPTCPDTDHEFDYTTKQWVFVRTLDELKARKIDELKVSANAANVANLVIQGVEFGASEASQTALMREALIAQMAVADGQGYMLNWDLPNGNTVTLTANQVKAVVRAIRTRTEATRAQFATLRASVNAATTAQQISEIVWH